MLLPWLQVCTGSSSVVLLRLIKYCWVREYCWVIEYIVSSVIVSCVWGDGLHI